LYYLTIRWWVLLHSKLGQCALVGLMYSIFCITKLLLSPILHVKGSGKYVWSVSEMIVGKENLKLLGENSEPELQFQLEILLKLDWSFTRISAMEALFQSQRCSRG
jgi:hypothetical protein